MLRVIYGGSPSASAKTLEILLKESLEFKETDESFKIVGVLTNPPSPHKSHRNTLVPTDVEAFVNAWNEANSDDIKVFTPEHIKQEERDAIKALNPDIFVCFAYGHIVGPKFLSLFRFGAINLHPSLLPKYRGATPVNAAILNMDSVTGYTVQKMALGVDEGDILIQKEITLTGTETAELLLNYSAQEGGKAISQILRATALSDMLPDSKPQEGEASYCTIIKKDDGKINWSDSAEKIDAQIRAYTPWPGCFTDYNGTNIRILKALSASKIAIQDPSVTKDSDKEAGTVLEYNKQRGILIQTGKGVLVATELQLQGKKAMDYKSFMNGARDFIGTVLK